MWLPLKYNLVSLSHAFFDCVSVVHKKRKGVNANMQDAEKATVDIKCLDINNRKEMPGMSCVLSLLRRCLFIDNISCHNDLLFFSKLTDRSAGFHGINCSMMWLTYVQLSWRHICPENFLGKKKKKPSNLFLYYTTTFILQAINPTTRIKINKISILLTQVFFGNKNYGDATLTVHSLPCVFCCFWL